MRLSKCKSSWGYPDNRWHAAIITEVPRLQGNLNPASRHRPAPFDTPAVWDGSSCTFLHTPEGPFMTAHGRKCSFQQGFRCPVPCTLVANLQRSTTPLLSAYVFK